MEAVAAKRILLVEDEQSLAETVKLNLELEGYHVTLAEDGRAALKAVKQARFNLVILDVMLPEIDGFSVCESIRLVNSELPVLFLTAKNSAADRIHGLKIGADDYLSKPFNLEELLLRVNNLVRRSTRKDGEPLSEYSFDGYRINFSRHEAEVPGKGTINLTKKEAALLRLLVERKNEVVSREHILEIVWGYDIYPSTRTIDNYIVTFRKYFEPDPSRPRYFHSVRGIGYKFSEAVPAG